MYSSINSRNYSVKGDKYTIIKPFTSSYNAILDVIKSDDNNLNKQINSPPPPRNLLKFIKGPLKVIN